MTKNQFILIMKSWADTRNIDALTAIEDALESLYENQVANFDIFSSDFETVIKDMIRKKSELGGKEAVLIAGYNEEENKIEIWESIGKAARENDGGNQGKISNCIKDGTRHLKRKWVKVLK